VRSENLFQYGLSTSGTASQLLFVRDKGGSLQNVRGESIRDQKPTIVHLLPWSGVGGVEISTLRLAAATRERFRHVAFCLPDATSLMDAFEKSGIETVTYIPPEPSLRHFRKFYEESIQVMRQLRRVGADVVHFSDLKGAYHNSFAAFLARSRRVCHIRSVYQHLSLRERLCLLPIQSFIFVSKEARRSFALDLADDKARVIYDPINTSAVDVDTTGSNIAVRRELGVSSESTIVGMVARVAPVKDYYTLTSAAAKVLSKYPDTRFVIVGDNSLVELNRLHYQEVVRRLEELNIADKFIFTGHRSDVSQLIAAMDISVLCSHREGFGLCLVESMAMRKPVIGTAVGGIPEIIQPGVTGYLHQHGNSKELADAILSLIEDPAKAIRFGEAGHERVKQNFSVDVFVDQISSAYSEVMDR
jgi:glycosyltransferase involved in cell wall biosynthesis